MTDKPVREMTRDESARHAERLVRQALDDPDHVGPLLHEALIMLRPFASESDETQPRAVLMIDGEIDWKTAQAIRGVTASEVKVLTETAGEAALKIGRAEATRDVIREVTVWVSELEDEALWDRWTAKRGTMLRARIPREASGATSDATSGVPEHQEVSEAVRSPQERGRCSHCGFYRSDVDQPRHHPNCPCASQEAR